MTVDLVQLRQIPQHEPSVRLSIRMALGAPRGRVVWMVMRQVAIMGAIGLAIGLPAEWAASRLVKSFLYGIKADDPSSIAVAIVTMALAVRQAGRYVNLITSSAIKSLANRWSGGRGPAKNGWPPPSTTGRR